MTEFEFKVLRRIERGGPMAGNRMVAVTAAARRLEKKGYAYKGERWGLTQEGREALKAAGETP